MLNDLSNFIFDWDNSNQILILYGNGNNGKTSLINLIKKILNEYCVSIPFDLIDNNTIREFAENNYDKNLLIHLVDSHDINHICALLEHLFQKNKNIRFRS